MRRSKGGSRRQEGDILTREEMVVWKGCLIGKFMGLERGGGGGVCCIGV